MNQTKESMIESLHRGVCKVTFEKVDGSTRSMNCTLKPTILAEENGAGFIQKETQLTEEAKNSEVVPVWDMDEQSWRSFRVSSVQGFETGSLLNG